MPPTASTRPVLPMWACAFPPVRRTPAAAPGRAAAATARTEAAAEPPPGSCPAFAEMVRTIVAPGGARAARSLSAWLARAERSPVHRDVHDFVLSHGHGVLERLDVADLEAATVWPTSEANRRHALGSLRKDEVEMASVENWSTPPWAFSYIFHDAMERLGRVPTWPDVLAFLRGPARDRLLDPFAADFALAGMDAVSRELHCAALRWRVGKAYYSFLREVDLFVRLRREHGLPVRYHLLADAQFKVDLWCGDVLVALLIVNKEFRDGADGRKRRVEDMMDASGFRRLSVELAAPTRWGRPTLCPQGEVTALASAIRGAMGRGEPLAA